MKAKEVLDLFRRIAEPLAQKFGVGAIFDEFVDITSKSAMIRLRYYLPVVTHKMPDTFVTLLSSHESSVPPQFEYLLVDLARVVNQLQREHFWLNLKQELQMLAKIKEDQAERQRLMFQSRMSDYQLPLAQGYVMHDIVVRLPLSARGKEITNDIPPEFWGHQLESLIGVIVFAYYETIYRGETFEQFLARIDRLKAQI